MNPTAYEKLRRIVYDQSGITLKDGKTSMVAARISQRIRALNLEDELAYVEYVEQSLDQEIVQLLDVISTNVTSFFRENHHFDFVRQQMQQWLSQGQNRFRFWSAASSTGEEPYSLAMTLQDVISESGRKPDVKILATDISTRVLAHAERGEYSETQVEPVSAKLRSRYLGRAEQPGRYRVSPSLRQMIVFRRMNLSQPPFPMRGPMDIIFCRNVMIYFDQKVRDGLLKEFHRLLRPDGYLIVGHAESLTQTKVEFSRVGSSVYRKAG